MQIYIYTHTIYCTSIFQYLGCIFLTCALPDGIYVGIELYACITFFPDLMWKPTPNPG